MKFEEFVKNVTQWATDRKFHTDATLQSQALKGMSELGELCDNLAKGKDIKDDIGDCAVVGVVINTILDAPSKLDTEHFSLFVDDASVSECIGNLAQEFCFYLEPPYTILSWERFEELYVIAERNNLDLEDCLETAWNDIKDRKGIMHNGVFIKEADPRYKELVNAS